MKAGMIVLIVLTAAGLINWARGGEFFPLPQAFPLCGGKMPSVTYDVLGGLGMFLLAIWGIRRLFGARPNQEDSPPEPEPEPIEAEEDDSQDEPSEEDGSDDSNGDEPLPDEEDN